MEEEHFVKLYQFILLIWYFDYSLQKDLEEVVESCMVEKMKHHLEVNLKDFMIVTVEELRWQKKVNNLEFIVVDSEKKQMVMKESNKLKYIIKKQLIYVVRSSLIFVVDLLEYLKVMVEQKILLKYQYF